MRRAVGALRGGGRRVRRRRDPGRRDPGLDRGCTSGRRHPVDADGGARCPDRARRGPSSGLAAARVGLPPPPRIAVADLYPDAIPCLRGIRAGGRVVGIAGNQPEGAEQQLRALGVEVDFVSSSARWGIEKPSLEFFGRVVAAAAVAPSRVVYVGDRLDNDVLPARAAGMRTVLIRGGPWGHLHSARPEADLADARIDSLTEIGRLLER